ncbi:hypothetical protein [Streptomyces sp. NBC_00151]|uniref:hypothetical protein n=1 Tax=Streptomyces sp. NBC_00151 TaxID=2975669 RepID=UPI002DDBBB25|nr:hypothetical protein [Streptomyces sp. NBC_00151]WRZ39675.1 hypothetical protein OG915_17475 [Streptomyces sp. NBC_00151]
MTFLAPAVLVAFVLFVLVAARCMRRLSAPEVVGLERTTWRWTGGALLGVLVTLLVYATGALAGFTQAAEICAIQAGRGPSSRPVSITESAFPPAHVCRWTDGTTVDLVPAWVGPLLYAGLAGVVVCSVLAVRAAAKRKKEFVHE